jgi:hypothetical protein
MTRFRNDPSGKIKVLLIPLQFKHFHEKESLGFTAKIAVHDLAPGDKFLQRRKSDVRRRWRLISNTEIWRFVTKIRHNFALKGFRAIAFAGNMIGMQGGCRQSFDFFREFTRHPAAGVLADRGTGAFGHTTAARLGAGKLCK